MLYHSTRGQSPAVGAAEALLRGAAGDGGLYMPGSLPDLSHLLLEDLPYARLAEQVFTALLPDFNPQEIKRSAGAAYGGQFESPQIAPLVKVGESYVLELFHGPTAAFKDMALQVLAQFMALARQRLEPDNEYLVLTATSGDTGSAAMRGFQGIPGFRVLVYYPHQGVSAVQLAQMTRLTGNNVKALGIRGDFDDAQAGVKAAFAADPALLPEHLRLSSANSINIGRLVPQIVYYIAAIKQLLASGGAQAGQEVDFIVPTGNFGDILAGYLAGRMGLPVGKLVCASNANRVLADFLQTGVYDRRRPLKKTLSPSMDILVSSNLERLLYEASGRDADRVAGLMGQLNEAGHYRADEDIMRVIHGTFIGCASSDAQALKAILEVWHQHHYLLDPHTAMAWTAQSALAGRKNPQVVLATASPFKFPETMFRALGKLQPSDNARLLPELSELTGLKVPRALEGLMDAPGPQAELIDKGQVSADAHRRARSW